MLNFCSIVTAILKMVTSRNFSTDFNTIWYVGRLWCPKLIPDIEKFLPVAIFKMATTIPHKFNIVRFQRHFICGYIMMKFWWYRTMLNFCGIVVAILKMATGRNFSMSGHHYLPTYQILMISDNVEFLRYCGADHELVHGRSQELLDRISWNVVGL
jgi:hypothetical protein